MNLKEYFEQEPPVGWTDSEEAAFAQIMAASGLSRIRAVQLFRRCKNKLALALTIADSYQVKADKADKVAETKAAKRNAGQLAIFEAA